MSRRLRGPPVEYHPNGQVKFPVTYPQLIRECQRLRAIASAAQAYVHIRSNDPQIAGEAWRNLCAAIDTNSPE